MDTLPTFLSSGEPEPEPVTITIAGRYIGSLKRLTAVFEAELGSAPMNYEEAVMRLIVEAEIRYLKPRR
jgi:hypothetical protein